MSIARTLIELEYQNSRQCARDLEDCARIIREVALSDVEGMMQELQTAWDGDAADMCIRKMDGAKNDIRRDGESVQRIADAIRRIADNVRRAEITAYNLTHKRKY